MKIKLFFCLFYLALIKHEKFSNKQAKKFKIISTN